MVGLVAVAFVGGIYCPLSPRDPQQRLQALLQQTNSRIVLVHHSTKKKFNDDIISPDIDLIFTQTQSSDETHVDRLSNVIVSPNHVAYIIFTSGSTGIPKAVCFSAAYCLLPFSFVRFRRKYDTGTLLVVCNHCRLSTPVFHEITLYKWHDVRLTFMFKKLSVHWLLELQLSCFIQEVFWISTIYLMFFTTNKLPIFSVYQVCFKAFSLFSPSILSITLYNTYDRFAAEVSDCGINLPYCVVPRFSFR